MQPQKEKFVSDGVFVNFKYEATKHLKFDVWDLSGLLPHLWVHHFNSVGGIIFVISQKDADSES